MKQQFQFKGGGGGQGTLSILFVLLLSGMKVVVDLFFFF